MDRISVDPEAMLQFFAAQWRATTLGQEQIADETRDANARADRVEICEGTKLRVFDDVEIYNGYVQTRIICGAPGDPVSFTGYRFDATTGGHCIENFNYEAITDRAPAVPEDGAPFPIVIPPIDDSPP